MPEILDSSDGAEKLNTGALGALLGFTNEWKTELVTLLRSGAPISETVRECLADAIEGTSPFGVTLQLDGHGAMAQRMKDLEARREWLIAAPVVAHFLNLEGNTLEGFSTASEHLNKSESYCRDAYYYHKHCTTWIDSIRDKGIYYSQMDYDELSHVWHFSSINQRSKKPVPPSPDEFDRYRKMQLAALTPHFHGWSTQEMAMSACAALWDLLPPGKDG